MKLRKRLIALTLAAACAATAFAGAAFTDQSDIKVDDYVLTRMQQLNIIKGYEDGSFKPNKTVTRAEMAKMIYVLRNGHDDASFYVNKFDSSFTDINDSWAKVYIEYCEAYHFVRGRTTTKYCPNEPVTTVEAAKMLLLELRYDPRVLTGLEWKQTVLEKADNIGLLNGVEVGPDDPLPRQYAAQMVYTARYTP